MKILVIEDNLVNRELVTDLLEMGDYAVLQAETAEVGIELAHQERPALILMDVALPGMDGIEATRTLRRDPRTCETPIVILTAHAMKGDEEIALSAGGTAYVTKPIDTRTFLSTVRQHLAA